MHVLAAEECVTKITTAIKLIINIAAVFLHQVVAARTCSIPTFASSITDTCNSHDFTPSVPSCHICLHPAYISATFSQSSRTIRVTHHPNGVCARPAGCVNSTPVPSSSPPPPDPLSLLSPPLLKSSESGGAALISDGATESSSSSRCENSEGLPPRPSSSSSSFQVRASDGQRLAS